MRGFPGPFRPRVIVGPGHEIWHWLIPLIFLVVLGAILIWAVLRVTRQPAAVGGPGWAATTTTPVRPAVDPAVDLVRARYARGEMSREQFLQAVADLGGALPETAPPLTTEPPGQTTTEPSPE